LHHKRQVLKHFGVKMTNNNRFMAIKIKVRPKALHSFTFSLKSYGISSTKEQVRKNNLFMQNKANFKKVKLNVTKVLTKDYDQMDTWSIRKTKPIQSQLKPIQSQLKPIQSQLKPIQSQPVLRSLRRSRIKANKMPKQTQLVLRSLWRSRIKPNLSRRSLWRRRKQTQNTEYMRSKRYGKNKPTSIFS
jgi:hypothetical protein